MPKPNVFRHRAFRNLFIGQTISLFGDACYNLVFLFYAHKVTHNDAVTGLAGAAGSLPFVLFGPMAGVLADRIDRRKILVACDLLSTILLLGVALYTWLIGDLNVVGIVSIAFILGSINSCFMPARSASLPRVVPPEDLIAANGVMQTTGNIMYLGGLALSVLVIGAVEHFAPRFFMPLSATVNAVTFMGSYLFIRLMPSVVPEHDATEHPGWWQQVTKGLSVVKADPIVRLALPVNGVCNLFVGGFMILYVKTNYELFGGQYWTLGFFEMSFFLVLCAFSAVAGKWPNRRPGLALSLGWMAAGLCMLPMGLTQNLWVYAGLNAACGILLPFGWLAMSAYMQVGFADSVRGRVSSTWSAMSQGVMPVGYIFMGGLLSLIGSRTTYILIGVVTAILSALPLLSRAYRTTTLQTKS